MKRIKFYILVLIGIVSIIPIEFTHAQQAAWIWYPGDFDIWLGNQVQNRRTERGTAWGASPIYLPGNYYLGIKPTSPGYQTVSGLTQTNKL